MAPDSHTTFDPLTYYATHSPMTDPREHADLLIDLPATVPDLCRVVQGSLLNVFAPRLYGATLTAARRQEVHLSPLTAMLARLRALDPRPLVVPRRAGQRLVGNCRHFTLLLCALVRQHGLPARARCGFATYLERDRKQYVDHWVCEVWDAARARWAAVDAELDPLMVARLRLTFDPYDVPPDQFVRAGRAWQLCRQEGADPQRFGIHDLRGLWFIRNNLLRDLAALNKLEALPWDKWGLMYKLEVDMTPEEWQLLDDVAALTLAGDPAFPAVRAIYAGNPRLAAPASWRPWEMTPDPRAGLTPRRAPDLGVTAVVRRGRRVRR
jgi:hypothetical protein